MNAFGWAFWLGLFVTWVTLGAACFCGNDEDAVTLLTLTAFFGTITIICGAAWSLP